MNHEQLNYRLIARYMSDKCSEEEEQIIKQWAQKSNNKQKLKQFKRIWDATENKAQNDDISINAREEWNRLQERFATEDESEDSATRVRSVKEQFRSSSIHSMTQRVVRVAVVFLVAGLLGILAYQNWHQPQQNQQEPALRQISTDKGQRANLTLSDGTEVMLNADSELELPTQFASDVREVFLNGEAYFKVSENKEKPFLVYSNESVVRVLGTAFSVRSYPEDQQVQVIVEEGRVSFGDQAGTENQKVILNKNELGAYDTTSNIVTAKNVDDIELYMSWRDGYLKFEETMLKDVARALERRYDVEVLFDDVELKERLLTAYLKSRSLRNVLEIITTSLEIEYQLEDNKITFSS